MNYPDIFFTPEYAQLFENTGFGGKLEKFRYGMTDYNFYVRSIPNTEYCDIVSPYGYSGPLNPSPEYVRIFHEWCVENNIVSEFARLHPFIENHKGLEPECVFQNGEVAYIDLTQPFQFDKGCKSAIKKAQNTGVTVANVHDPTTFNYLYGQTMKRNLAEDDYFFGGKFFPHLIYMTGAWMFLADYQDAPVSAIIILFHGDYAHYFLAGSDERYLKLGANNLLLSEAIQWAKEQGCKIFNLGGGKDDSHMSFKRSFSHRTKPFYTYRKIHNKAVYDELSKGIQPYFFPAYRNPQGKNG